MDKLFLKREQLYFKSSVIRIESARGEVAKILHSRIIYYFWLTNNFHFRFPEDFSINLISKNRTFSNELGFS